MSQEPGSLVLELLRGIHAEISTVKSDMSAMKAELKGDIATLRADVASGFVLMEARNMAEHKKTRDDTRDQVNGLRRAVMQYHSTVIGHGSLYSELEERVQRMEQHLNLPFVPKDAH